MVERTLADEIISIVHSEANNNPLPLKCTIQRGNYQGSNQGIGSGKR